MAKDEKRWKPGDLESFPWTSRIFKEKGSTSYKHFYSSRFICIREEDDEHPGILLKVLGRTSPHDIMIVGDEPFCKDERDDLLKGKAYSSYRFPTVEQLTEALAIVRENPQLMSVFEESSMHFNPQSTFWVRELTRKHLFQKKPQFYDASTGNLCSSSDETLHYRLTILYFKNGNLTY